jgi:hypothetical protein
MYRYLVVLLGSLTIALVLVVLGVLLPMASAGKLLLQATPTPRAFTYLPYVAKQYPPAPTETPTPTATPTSTPTPMPQIIFRDDFESGQLIVSPSLEHWRWLHQQGATVEVIDDPTGRGGKVLKCTVTGDSQLEPDGNYRRRGYPDWYNGPFTSATNIPAPCGISVDVWVSPEFSPGDPFPGATLLSLFTNDRQTGAPSYIVAIALSLDGQPLSMFSSIWVRLVSQ